MQFSMVMLVLFPSPSSGRLLSNSSLRNKEFFELAKIGGFAAIFARSGSPLTTDLGLIGAKNNYPHSRP